MDRCPLQVRDELLPQAKEFKYLRVLFKRGEGNWSFTDRLMFQECHQEGTAEDK